MTIMTQSGGALLPLERAVVRVSAWQEDGDLDDGLDRLAEAVDAARKGHDGGGEWHWNVVAEVAGMDRELILGEYDGEDEARDALWEVFRMARHGARAVLMPPRGFGRSPEREEAAARILRGEEGGG